MPALGCCCSFKDWNLEHWLIMQLLQWMTNDIRALGVNFKLHQMFFQPCHKALQWISKCVSISKRPGNNWVEEHTDFQEWYTLCTISQLKLHRSLKTLQCVCKGKRWYAYKETAFLAVVASWIHMHTHTQIRFRSLQFKGKDKTQYSIMATFSSIDRKQEVTKTLQFYLLLDTCRSEKCWREN